MRNRVREAYAEHFHVPYRKMQKLSLKVLEQLNNCQSEAAIRLLLGISRKEQTPCPHPKDQSPMHEGQSLPLHSKPEKSESTTPRTTTGKRSRLSVSSAGIPDGSMTRGSSRSTPEQTSRGGKHKLTAA